jgi:vesicle transport through interaction with t-SNAREs protein 1
MTITVSELFRDFEADFERLRADIDEQLDAAGSTQAAASFVERCLNEAENRAGEAEKALKQMEMEVRMMPPDQRRDMEPKVKQSRAQLVERRKALGAAKSSHARQNLLGEGDSRGRRDRERLLDVDDSFRRSSSQLDEAHRAALETEQIGIDVMSDLRQQRDTILRTRGNVNEIGQNVAIAKQMLIDMSRRAMANKMITYVAVGSLGLMVVAAIYFGLKAEDKDDEQVQVLPGFQRSAGSICAGTAYTINDNIGCNGWGDLTELQCQEKCETSTQAKNCPSQPCKAAAFHIDSGRCHLYAEAECQAMRSFREVNTYKKESQAISVEQSPLPVTPLHSAPAVPNLPQAQQ